jgi:hypothetical protein
MTKQRFETGRLLYDPDHSGAHAETVLLLAGNLTGVTAAAIFFVEFYRNFSHVNLLFIFTGIDIA